MSKTKAKTLDRIKDRITHFNIPKFIYFDKSEWLRNKDEVLRKIQSEFCGSSLAVRSSASDEDGAERSMAGEYESVLNVSSDNIGDITSAVDRVFLSYQKNGERVHDDEVIVQKMINNTSLSGVIFTHDLNTGAPYYVVNYDDVSGKTDTVTSGGSKHSNRTLYIHRGTADALRSERFQSLIRAVQDLEEIMESRFLDIEFAVSRDLEPILFQVRAITTQPNWNRAVAKRINATLNGIQLFVREKFRPMNGVYGKSTVLGQMPDWNPAEMIGRAPRNLAYSLYEKLITEDAWRVARERMGYAVPAGQPLMVSLAGQPFIDTRLSFHSYLPGTLSDEISEKLVDVWVKKLKDHPELHDKVEFDVAITIYSFDIDEKIKSHTGGMLTEKETSEFKDSLHNLTHDLILGTNKGSIDKALADIDYLGKRQSLAGEKAIDMDLNSLFTMIKDCISYGTIPFSILARHGFIARTILISLQKSGIFTADDIGRLQRGIRTVAGDLVGDMIKLQNSEIGRDEFMELYGHLRPGTYDILSLRYDQIEDFGTNGQLSIDHEIEPFTLDTDKKEAINKLLKAEGFEGIDADFLHNYFQRAIAGREYGKFIFTRTVSNMLELIANFAELNGLSRDEVSHIKIDDILAIATASDEKSIEDRLRNKAEEGAEFHNVSSAIRLPQVLFDEEGVHVVPFQVSHPNFITDKRVDAECIYLKSSSNLPEIEDKIILIESADPGFDWIFAHKIAGLITKFGGANSHMAIRCAEFNIPAAIGCGEQRFEACTKGRKISMDCAAGLIQTQL